MHDNFKLGDKVICKCDYDDILKGYHGVIVAISYYLGCEWKEFTEGHSCGGRGADDKCWNVPKECVKIDNANTNMIFRVNSSGSFRIRKIRSCV